MPRPIKKTAKKPVAKPKPKAKKPVEDKKIARPMSRKAPVKSSVVKLVEEDLECKCSLREPEDGDDTVCRQCGGIIPQAVATLKSALENQAQMSFPSMGLDPGNGTSFSAVGPVGLAAKMTQQAKEPPALPHLIIEARAGTGKTTTLVEGLRLVKGLPTSLTPSPQQAAVWKAMELSKGARSVCFVAFNNSIVEVLKTKVPAGCDTKTMHRLGFQAVRKRFEVDGNTIELNRDRVKNLICKVMGTTIELLRMYEMELLKATEELVGLCKMNLVHPWNDSPWSDNVDDIVDHYDLEISGSRDKVYNLTEQVLYECREVTDNIDFNDMPWLPVVLNLPVYKFDLLLIDEAQDLNRCSQALAKMAGRRLILCGDPKQAIYGFAGADSQSMARMYAELNESAAFMPLVGDARQAFVPVGGCLRLPLTVTRRCGKAIVAEAKKLVPDFEAFPTNPEGKVLTMAMKTYHEKVNDHDIVLCRTNAPLISECFRFIRLGRVAKVQGNDVGQRLISLIKKSKTTTSEGFMQWLNQWRDQEESKERGNSKPNESKLLAIADRYECLVFIAVEASTTTEMVRKIEAIFSDEDDRPGILLTSIHRSKGLEAQRVFFLKPPKGGMPKNKMQPWEMEQEDNLEYVGRTRAIEELIYVR